jgi:hypothetical protein
MSSRNNNNTLSFDHTDKMIRQVPIKITLRIHIYNGATLHTSTTKSIYVSVKKHSCEGMYFNSLVRSCIAQWVNSIKPYTFTKITLNSPYDTKGYLEEVDMDLPPIVFPFDKGVQIIASPRCHLKKKKVRINKQVPLSYYTKVAIHTVTIY